MRGQERIPLHDHVDRNSGGRIAPSTVVQAVGGSTTVISSTPEGQFLTTTYGEQAKKHTNPASGVAVQIDCALANVFDITLTANCTLSIVNPPPVNVAGIITVILRQGGTGSYTVTWPASVVWQDSTDGTTGGSAPTLWTAVGAQDVIDLATEDGGTTWGGTPLSSGASLTIKDEGTPLATAATSIDFVGAGVVASGAGAAKTVTVSGAPTGAAGGDLAGTYPNPTLVAASVTALLPPAHAHVVGETHLSDGSTTTYTLDEYFEPGSVEAFNTTTLAYLIVTETQPDQATVSAAGSSGDKITFSYAATLA